MRYTYFILMSILAFQAQAQWEAVYQISSNNIYELYAPDKDHVFLGTEQGDLYQSVNAGEDYDIKDLQEFGFIYSIEFEDELKGYAGGGCYFPFDECPGNTFYKTEDGGTTWDQLQGNLLFGVYTDIETMGSGKLYATNEFTGLHYSTDGGANLLPIFIDNILNNARYQQVQFMNEQIGYVGVINFGANSSITQYIYKTEDAGLHWSSIFEIVESYYDNGGFFFTDEHHGFVLGNEGKIWNTSDGGSTWTEQQYGGTNEMGRGIYFPSANTGYIASHYNDFSLGRIYRTNNGGQSWELDLEVDSTFFDYLHFTDENNGYAVSYYNTVYRRGGTNHAEEKQLAAIEIYPNPAKEFIEISGINSSLEYQIIISDIAGKFIQTIMLNDDKTRIQVGHLAAGIYCVNILDIHEKSMGMGRFVKTCSSH